jgi:PAS domain S-box-containing protein
MIISSATPRHRAEWSYETFLEHVLPEDRPEVDRLFREALSTQSDWDFECRIRRTDGALRWIWAAGKHQHDAHGSARRMTGIVQDITERKQAELQLRKLSLAVEQSPESILITDLDARIEYVNESCLRSTGYTRDELMGRNPRMLGASKAPRQTSEAMWGRADARSGVEGRVLQSTQGWSRFHRVCDHLATATARRSHQPLCCGQGRHQRKKATRRRTQAPPVASRRPGGTANDRTRCCAAAGRNSQSGQDSVPGEHEPRDPHPIERHHRPDPPLAARRSHY